MTPTDLERRLRDELAGLAATTRTAPDALDSIVGRAARSPGRRMVALVAAAALVLLLVAVAVAVAGDEPAQRVAAELPRRPPEIAGTIHAEVLTNPCVGDCIEGQVRFPITDPQMLELFTRDGVWSEDLDTGITSHHPLRDGRYFTTDANGSLLVDPTDGTSTPLGPGLVVSADVLADGRIVMVMVDDGAALATVDAESGTVTPVPLPGGFYPSGVAVGPDGTIGVLGDESECCEDRDVMLLAPDGDVAVLDIADALDGRGLVVEGRTAMAWSATGLLAISQDLPEPWIEAQPRFGWTVVVDSDGHRVAALDGWQGLAWSPDGSGLLLAQRAGRRSSDLAVFWGPELSERTDLGTVPIPVLPRFWLP